MRAEDPGAGRGTKELSRTVLAALPVALTLPLVALVALGFRGCAPSARFSMSAAFAVLASITLAAFVALTHRSRPRAGVLAACHALAWVPFLAVSAWQSIDAAIVSRPVRGCGTGLMAFVVFAAPVGAIVSLVLGTAAGIVFVRRGADRASRSVAVAATGLALVAFAFAGARMARPDPDTYLASLEPAAELHAGESVQIGGRDYRYERGAPTDPIPVRTMEGGAVLPPRVDCILLGADEPKPFYAPTGTCATLRLRVDHRADLVVVDAPRDADLGRVAFLASTGMTTSVSPATVADHIAPPIGWTIGAGLGGLIGAACVLAASRARRRAAAIDAREGKHSGGGVVELVTGETLRVDAAAGLPLGPVVLGHIGEQLPTYRQTGTPTFGAAWPGTLADMRGKLTDLATSLDAVAIAAAMLGATPLLVARLAAGL